MRGLGQLQLMFCYRQSKVWVGLIEKARGLGQLQLIFCYRQSKVWVGLIEKARGLGQLQLIFCYRQSKVWVGLIEEARGLGQPLEPDCQHIHNASSFGVTFYNFIYVSTFSIFHIFLILLLYFYMSLT